MWRDWLKITPMPAMLAQALAELPAVSLNPTEVETNIVIFDVGATGHEAKTIGERLEKAGVRVSVIGRTKLRAVTHLDVSRQDIEMPSNRAI